MQDSEVDSSPTTTGEEVVKQEDSPKDASGGEVVIQQSDWDVEGEVSQFLLSNVGDAPAGTVTVVCRWFDSNGNYLGNDQASLPVLPSQRTWLVKVGSSAPFGAARFDGYLEFDTQYRTDDLPVGSVEIDRANSRVTGIVTPNRETETAIQAVALTYDSGWVTHTGSSIDSRIPGETDWRFSIPLTQIGAEEPAIGEEVETIFTIL